jgi:hypothetical protein
VRPKNKMFYYLSYILSTYRNYTRESLLALFNSQNFDIFSKVSDMLRNDIDKAKLNGDGNKRENTVMIEKILNLVLDLATKTKELTPNIYGTELSDKELLQVVQELDSYGKLFGGMPWGRDNYIKNKLAEQKMIEATK